MLSILRKARLKDKELRILMLSVDPFLFAVCRFVLIFLLGFALRWFFFGQQLTSSDVYLRGLDNAGKTTIVKQIMGEDVNTVSPTLGFIIKTIDYEG